MDFALWFLYWFDLKGEGEMEEWASSVVKARMLKQGMSPHLVTYPMRWLSGRRARGRQLHHIRELTFKTSTTLKYVVMLLSAKVPSEVDCLLYPTLILPFFHSVGKYSRSSETVRQGLLTQGLRSQEKKGKTFQTINNVKKNCVRLTNSGSTCGQEDSS